MKNTLYMFLILLGGFLQSTWTLAEEAESEPAPTVGVAEASTIQSQISRRYTGKIISCSVVRIVSCCSGQILEVGFKDGDRVKKGQTLYKLDPIQLYFPHFFKRRDLTVSPIVEIPLEFHRV